MVLLLVIALPEDERLALRSAAGSGTQTRGSRDEQYFTSVPVDSLLHALAFVVY